MAPTAIYTLSLHDALPILPVTLARSAPAIGTHMSRAVNLSPAWAAIDARPAVASDTASSAKRTSKAPFRTRSEEHTSELQSLAYLVCRLLLEKKKLTLTQF